MVLESLLELVETLRKRIDEHGAALRQSEALTRAALIDPMLRELGWDTENPALVIPEYRSSAGSADYALISDSSQPPVLIIEAKKLGESLDDRVALQSLNYCNLIGTPHFALTDGKTWKIYSTFEQAPLADRLIATFSIGEMSAAAVCLQALALWRHSVEVGVVSGAKTPIVGLDAINRTEHESVDLLTREPEPTPQEQPAIRQATATVAQSSEADQEWIALSDWEVRNRDMQSLPVEIQFPNGRRTHVSNWYEMITEPVRWLINNNILNSSHCPVQVRRGKRFIVASNPFHSNGKEFTQPEQIGSLHVETHFSREEYIRHVKRIIDDVGQDPAQFKVRLR